jgi:hypothetical protein
MLCVWFDEQHFEAAKSDSMCSEAGGPGLPYLSPHAPIVRGQLKEANTPSGLNALSETIRKEV